LSNWTYNAEFAAIASPEDDLRNGIWPRSAVLWIAVGWIALDIIRPWEIMLPELAPLHVARLYALGMIAVVVCSGSFRMCRSFQTTGVLLFLAALAASWCFAGDSTAAYDELYKYATLVAFYFVLLSVIRTPYQLGFVVLGYLAVMAAYLGKSQWEYFVHGHHVYTMGVYRLIGIDENNGSPNGLAASIVLSLPFLHLAWRERHTLSETWPRFWQKWLPRFLIAYFLLAMTSVMLTNSRSGMLGFVVFVVLSLMAGKKLGKRVAGVIYALAFLAVVWMMMPAEKQERLRTVWQPDAGPSSAKSSADGRVEGMLAGLEMFRRHPITGAGIGNFVVYRVAELDGVRLQSHSLLGQTLGETGLFGAAAFGLMLVGTFVNCRRTERTAKEYPHPTLAVLARTTSACRMVIVLLLFFGLFGHNLLRFNWLWMAAFGLLCRMFAEEICSRPPADEDFWEENYDLPQEELVGAY